MLLESNGSVGVPGLGVVSRKFKSARTAPADGVIHPPETTGSFDPSHKTKGRLLEQYIMYQTGAPKPAVRMALKQFASNIDAHLKSSGKLALTDFGTLELSGKSIVFSPDASAFNAGYNDLDIVQLLPEMAPIEELPPAPVVPNALTPGVALDAAAVDLEAAPKIEVDPGEIHERKKTRLPLIIAILMALFLGMCAFAYIQYKVRKSAITERMVINRSPVSDRTPQTDSSDKAALKLDTNEQQVEETEADPLGTITPTDNVSSEMPVPADDGASQRQMTPSPDCVIIVGAFGVEANVQRMLDRLNAMNLTTTTIVRGELTQVGVGVVCDSQEMTETLAVLQAQVEPQSWVFYQ